MLNKHYPNPSSQQIIHNTHFLSLKGTLGRHHYRRHHCRRHHTLLLLNKKRQRDEVTFADVRVSKRKKMNYEGQGQYKGTLRARISRYPKGGGGYRSISLL